MHELSHIRVYTDEECFKVDSSEYDALADALRVDCKIPRMLLLKSAFTNHVVGIRADKINGFAVWTPEHLRGYYRMMKLQDEIEEEVMPESKW